MSTNLKIVFWRAESQEKRVERADFGESRFWINGKRIRLGEVTVIDDLRVLITYKPTGPEFIVRVEGGFEVEAQFHPESPSDEYTLTPSSATGKLAAGRTVAAYLPLFMRALGIQVKWDIVTVAHDGVVENPQEQQLTPWRCEKSGLTFFIKRAPGELRPYLHERVEFNKDASSGSLPALAAELSKLVAGTGDSDECAISLEEMMMLVDLAETGDTTALDAWIRMNYYPLRGRTAKPDFLKTELEEVVIYSNVHGWITFTVLEGPPQSKLRNTHFAKLIFILKLGSKGTHAELLRRLASIGFLSDRQERFLGFGKKSWDKPEHALAEVFQFYVVEKKDEGRVGGIDQVLYWRPRAHEKDTRRWSPNLPNLQSAALDAEAYQNEPLLRAMTGDEGHSFWHKLCELADKVPLGVQSRFSLMRLLPFGRNRAAEEAA